MATQPLGVGHLVRVAVIGAGHWGPNLIRNFEAPPASTVKLVVDRDADRLRQVRDRFPGTPVAEDAGAALSDPGVDAVVIATPTATHHGLARAALEAGKHVLVEKPITNDSRQAQELIALAERRQRVLMVGHVFLFNPAVRQAHAAIASGQLGRIHYLSMIRTNLGPIRADVNAAWDLMSHDISICNHWLGAEPEAASAIGGTWLNAGREDAVFATLRYPAGVLANVQASWLSPRKTRDITVVGDRGMLTFDDLNVVEPLRLYDRQARAGNVAIPRTSPGEPLRNQCAHFLDCVRTGQRPSSGGSESAAVVRALEAIDRSMREHGREQRVGGDR